MFFGTKVERNIFETNYITDNYIKSKINDKKKTVLYFLFIAMLQLLQAGPD